MNTRLRAFQILLALTGTIGAVRAQTITVDITDADVIDVDPNTATVADLPGPDGHISFSEAMIASNNTPGRQTVGFAIPTSQWTHLPAYYPGRAVIYGMMFYTNAYAEVTIDGTTQTAFTGDTNPDGWEVVILRNDLYFPADNCTITGLDQTPIYIEGANTVVENNSAVGIEIYGGFGSAGSGSGNLVKDNTGGLQIVQANDNVVVGNVLNRVRLSGQNNRIGGPTPAERNHIIGTGTWTSQGVPGGFAIGISNSTGTLIENNWIGMSLDGLSQGHPASIMGIYFDADNSNTTIRNNRIAGILAWAVPPHGPAYQLGSAIQLYGSGSGVTIVGNKIGLDANDQPVLGSLTGITTVHFFYPNGIPNVVIGGSAAGEGNEIAGHLQAGVSVANTYSEVRITGNSIHDNGGLGIDLITSDFLAGVTPNDSLDADTGGNGLQNFPVIASAAFQGVQLHLVGSVHSSAAGLFRVEFFGSPGCDPSGFGEGQTYLGSTSVSTNASGDGAFDVLLAASAPSGWSVTATATREPIGATSEFSACVPISGSPGTSFCAGDGTSGSCPCGNSGSPGRGCQNSAATGGSILTTSGVASLSADSLQHTASGELPTALSIVLQGDTAMAPASFGDGLRCTGGVLKRLYVKSAIGGVVTAPQAGDPSVSARSAALGDPIPTGATRNYQVYYRDASATFCPDPPGGTFNVSNAIAVAWGN